MQSSDFEVRNLDPEGVVYREYISEIHVITPFKLHIKYYQSLGNRRIIDGQTVAVRSSEIMQ